MAKYRKKPIVIENAQSLARRPVPAGVRRTYRCRQCGLSFTTCEQLEFVIEAIQ